MIKYEDRENIKTDQKLLGKIMYKPNEAFIAIIILALIMMFVKYYIISLVLLIVAILGILFIKDHTILEVYQDYLLLYDNREHDKACKIDYSNIYKWDVSRNASFQTELYIDNEEREIITFECFSTGKVISLLKQVMPEKQAIEIGIELRRNKKR